MVYSSVGWIPELVSAAGPLPDLLNNGMEDLEGTLEVWVDDLQLGTGEASSAGSGSDCPPGFETHLQARMEKKAATPLEKERLQQQRLLQRR